jgi:hypothetical protein
MWVEVLSKQSTKDSRATSVVVLRWFSRTQSDRRVGQEASMRLRIRNPFYLKEIDKRTLIKVVCHHCGNQYHIAYGNIRVSNYCSKCK